MHFEKNNWCFSNGYGSGRDRLRLPNRKRNRFVSSTELPLAGLAMRGQFP
jgi:hypothetical protein